MKKKKVHFRYVESELFHYQETKSEVARLREEIMNSKSGVDNVGGRSNLPSDPTGDMAVTLLTNRKLERMEKTILAIDSVLRRLPEDRLKLITLRYWTKPQTLTWDGMAMRLERDRVTLIRWRNEVVNAIAEMLGF